MHISSLNCSDCQDFMSAIFTKAQNHTCKQAVWKGKPVWKKHETTGEWTNIISWMGCFHPQTKDIAQELEKCFQNTYGKSENPNGLKHLYVLVHTPMKQTYGGQMVAKGRRIFISVHHSGLHPHSPNPSEGHYSCCQQIKGTFDTIIVSSTFIICHPL